MPSDAQISQVIETLAAAAQPLRIVLFGSHARGDARADSDVDLLVIEDEVTDRAREMIRLRRALRPLRVPVDVLVASVQDIARYAEQPGHVLFWALKEGRSVYERPH